LSLGEAHAVAEQVERTILKAVPEASTVRTHLEPLAEISEGWRPSEWEADELMEAVLRIVTEELGVPPRALRVLETGDGIVLFLTLALEPHTELVAAHERASAVEERIRRERPDVADVHVHTEP
jgi:divalent metal cation (Fe/Co/Zn/Cd) transporter